MATTLYAHDPLLSSPAMTMTAATMSSEDCWTMPTPPVSPKVEAGVDDDDLDLGLGDILGLNESYLLPGLTGFDQEWLFGEVQNEVSAQAEATCTATNAGGETTPSPLRHDCMWGGHCPAEEQHRLTSGLHPQLPSFLLSSSPTDPSHILMSTSCRTRLDTLGSIRPETPLSLSDSEMDADPLTSSQESGSSSSSGGSSSSADESETDEVMMPKFLLPANINPVRSSSHRSKPMKAQQSHNNNNNSSQLLTAADHSYSHSDHSYHTQRRPASDHHGALTPSDSEEEIDVVSLGEVLRMNPKSSVTSSIPSTNSTTTTTNAPIRLKLKVSPASFTQSAAQQQQPAAVVQRKALPPHPSALVRQQLQMAVAASAATRQVKAESAVKKTEQQQQQTKPQQKRPRSALQDSDSTSGSRSPRKSSARGSRAGSDSEDSCEKRSQHNSMERQRRVDLRNAFEFLRSLIPDLEAADRAAKVVILKKASLYCQGLTARERQYVTEKDALQKRQEMLRKRIALLQRRR